MQGHGRPRGSAATNSYKVGKLDEVHVPVLDLDRMRAFYLAELGFQKLFEHKGRMLALDTGGAMLVLDSTKPRVGPTYLGFKVKGTGELVSRLRAIGIKVVTPTSKQHWGELLTCVEDPEGNVLAFEESTAKARPHAQRHHHSAGPRSQSKDRR